MNTWDSVSFLEACFTEEQMQDDRLQAIRRCLLAMGQIAGMLNTDEENLMGGVEGGLILQAVDDNRGGVSMTAPEKGTCFGCGEAILWGRTKADKRIPLDERILSVVGLNGEVYRGRESHFASCPKAKAFRQGKPALKLVK